MMKTPPNRRRLVFGVGINDADYLVHAEFNDVDALNRRIRKLAWACPCYQRWKKMLARCYCQKELDRFPSYRGCSVHPDWLRFSVFKAWMEQQDWEGKELDKDLLVPGNRVYGPETCVFIPSHLNTYLTDKKSKSTNLPTGVKLQKSGRYSASASCKGKRAHLGMFNTAEEAAQAWLRCKLEHATRFAAEVGDERIGAALINRYRTYQQSMEKVS